MMRVHLVGGLLAGVLALGGGLLGGVPMAAAPQQAAAPAEDIKSPGPSAARYPKNAAEFDEYFNKIKNWGRWGKDDELGTLNLITDAKRKQAASLVKVGQAVGLAHSPITETTPDNPSPFKHTMNRGFTTDTYEVSYHGYAHSHMDALCHILYKDQTYNGFAKADINTEKGCTKLSIQNMRNGYVTRGILLDIPRLRGVRWLESGEAVTRAELEAWDLEQELRRAFAR